MFNSIVDVIPRSFIFLATAYKFENISREMTLEKKELKAELLVLEGIKNENAELKKALNFSHNSAYNFKLIPAFVYERASESWNNIIVINVGIKNGVRIGNTVIAEEGLVGRVVAVDDFSSKVMLITSLRSSVSVIMVNKKTFGIARGGFGADKLIIDYVSEGADVSLGEKIMVSPASNVFIPGVPLAYVSKVENSVNNIFQFIEAKPIVNFSGLRVVFVCKP
ncbi:rod shape-determining protein MreC [candidate division WOR-1 bacterium RIFOXYD2_FULL_36_8]|nr:MAG: rod shape-determining protein MreC [candidate division WOR-1 bacterium RIFOXYD2_FULL_36_8]